MTDDDVDVRELDRRALAAVGDIVAEVTPADLDLPTPCSEWSLATLLEHLVNENRGYAASALGAPAIVSIWYSGRLEPDPLTAYRASAAWAEQSFTTPGVFEDSFEFEVRDFGYHPAPVAIGMHFVDVLVHGWDVAVSIGLPYAPDDELTAGALALVSRWPSKGDRRKHFGRRVRVPADAPDFARLLGLLGRSPSWTPPRDPRP